MSFSLYLHFPFCFNKCSYCDFYKELYSEELEQNFFESLKIETRLAIAKLRQAHHQTLKINTIFIGGGTPSIAMLELFEDWLNLLKNEIEVPPGIEFSFECNPESITLEKLEKLQNLGVTRPTFGVQTFDKELLKILDRRHNPHHTQQAVYMANALRFKQFGLDLIFGIPKQTSKILKEDLDQLLNLNPPHISYYQLILEEGTRLHARYTAGEFSMDTQETMAALYRIGCEKFKEAGYTQYEICSFAKPGSECRHNIAYWQGDDYLGLGPAAHSFINGERFYNPSSLVEYKLGLDHNELPRTIDQSGKEQRMIETIMLGLRTMWGVNRVRFERKFEMTLDDQIDQTQYELLLKSGHILDDGKNLKLTAEGLYLTDEIINRLTK